MASGSVGTKLDGNEGHPLKVSCGGNVNRYRNPKIMKFSYLYNKSGLIKERKFMPKKKLYKPPIDNFHGPFLVGGLAKDSFCSSSCMGFAKRW